MKIFYTELDKILDKIYSSQKQYINCKKGCSYCCSKGDYPISQPEFSYLTQGFIDLPQTTKIIVQQNIRKLLADKKEYKGERFEHECPFLINGECCVYDYRGIICRTFGLAYYDDEKKYVRLPDCVTKGLNYSQYYDSETKILNIKEVPKINLRIDKIFEMDFAKNFDYIEIKPMLEWLKG